MDIDFLLRVGLICTDRPRVLGEEVSELRSGRSLGQS